MSKEGGKPLVSVVMSVYNGQDYVEEAIDSILNQSFTNFEFIIINDGSTDDTLKKIKRYKDPRIKLIIQENRGLVDSLNTGINLSRAKYIARQDADDVSSPERLNIQIKELIANPRLVLIGSSIKVIDEHSKTKHDHMVLINDNELRQELLVRSPFAHGSVIFSRDMANKAGLYNKDYFPAEDYELWLRLSNYGSLMNINEPLYLYREHGSGISVNNQKMQNLKVDKIKNEAWEIRRKLVKKSQLKLGYYKNLKHGKQRVDRIINDIAIIIKKAIINRDFILVARVAQKLILSKSAYQKFGSRFTGIFN